MHKSPPGQQTEGVVPLTLSNSGRQTWPENAHVTPYMQENITQRTTSRDSVTFPRTRSVSLPHTTPRTEGKRIHTKGRKERQNLTETLCSQIRAISILKVLFGQGFGRREKKRKEREKEKEKRKLSGPTPSWQAELQGPSCENHPTA